MKAILHYFENKTISNRWMPIEAADKPTVQAAAAQWIANEERTKNIKLELVEIIYFDPSEENVGVAFYSWVDRNQEFLFANAPTSQNFIPWCRKVYTGAIRFDKVLK